jgi:hypothetical protein
VKVYLATITMLKHAIRRVHAHKETLVHKEILLLANVKFVQKKKESKKSTRKEYLLGAQLHSMCIWLSHCLQRHQGIFDQATPQG